MSTKQDGDWGEALVEKYLSERGCRIVEREWRCRFGEIDLIAEKDGVLLFVEVKLRTNLQYGAPREYVTVKKQGKAACRGAFVLERARAGCARPLRRGGGLHRCAPQRGQNAHPLHRKRILI